MGRRIGRYEMGKTLGKGTFSKVKHAIDSRDGKEVAIKVIDKERMNKEMMQDQIKREISITKLLRHENIVELLDVFQTPKYIYLVMELVTGGELFTRLVKKTQFSEEEARRYFQQLILGVTYCHNQGIAHRDLKPENLLLDADNNLKISDFGLSNLQTYGAEGGDNLLTTVCGTPNYVAPEVLNNHSIGYNGIPADVWSCGIILYVMLAGILPFDDPDINTLFKMIETSDYRVPAHFNKDAADLIAGMLDKDPFKRMSMQEVIRHPWFQQDFDNERLKATRRPIIVPDNAGTDEMESVDEFDCSGYSTHSSPSSTARRSSALDGFEVEGRLSTPAGGPDRILMGSLLLDAPVSESMHTLVACLEKLKANPKTKDGSNEIRGFCHARRSGLLAYSVLCLATTAKGALVEVRRVRGDNADFDEFFYQLKSLVEMSIPKSVK